MVRLHALTYHYSELKHWRVSPWLVCELQLLRILKLLLNMWNAWVPGASSRLTVWTFGTRAPGICAFGHLQSDDRCVEKQCDKEQTNYGKHFSKVPTDGYLIIAFPSDKPMESEHKCWTCSLKHPNPLKMLVVQHERPQWFSWSYHLLRFATKTLSHSEGEAVSVWWTGTGERFTHIN